LHHHGKQALLILPQEELNVLIAGKTVSRLYWLAGHWSQVV